MKKVIALAIVLIMVLGLCAACSSGGGSKDKGDKPKELTVWLQQTFSEEFNEGYAALYKEFGEQNGIKMNVEILDAADLRDTKLPAAIESGDIPNITMMEPMSLYPYVKAGKLVETTDVVAELKTNGTEFYESLLAAAKVDGKLYAVPYNAQSWMLWYRKDKLEAAGYDHAPATWEEMLEMAKAITDPADNFYGAGFAAGATASDFNNMSQSMLWSYGGSVMKNNKLNLDSAESRAAIEMELKFFEEGTVAPDMIAGDDMANNTAMLSGTAGFIVNIPTIANALKTDAPEIWEVTGCSPLPAGPNGSYPLAAVGMMSIFDTDEVTNEWAKKALAYAIDESRLGKVLELVAPAYGMVYADTMEKSGYMSDPVVAAHMEAISTGKYYCYPDDSLTLERALLMGSTTYINNIISYVIVEGMSFDDAMARQISICEQALAEAK